jgi:hypothetical protein
MTERCVVLRSVVAVDNHAESDVGLRKRPNVNLSACRWFNRRCAERHQQQNHQQCNKTKR